LLPSKTLIKSFTKGFVSYNLYYKIVMLKSIHGRALIEASGGITLDKVRGVAETGVDFISVGALTHSVKALDISLEVESPSWQ